MPVLAWRFLSRVEDCGSVLAVRCVRDVDDLVGASR